MKAHSLAVCTAVACSLIAGGGWAAELESTKAELMGRVEEFFLNNFKDITARKSLAWGNVEVTANGDRSIRYEYEARIWEKDTQVMNQVFTFDRAGKFVCFTNVAGFPKPKQAKPADTSSDAGMKELVADFFKNNFRDVTRRETIEWGPVTKTSDGKSSIRYKYLATIWNKNTVTNDQVFTFEPGGRFVSVKDANTK